MVKIVVLVLLLVISGSHCSDDEFGSHPRDQPGLPTANICTTEKLSVHCYEDDCISYCQSEYGPNYVGASCKWIKRCECSFLC